MTCGLDSLEYGPCNWFEGTKRPAHTRNKSPERLALNSPFRIPLRGTCGVPLVWPHITPEAFSMTGGGLLRAHKYHMPKSCQEDPKLHVLLGTMFLFMQNRLPGS